MSESSFSIQKFSTNLITQIIVDLENNGTIGSNLVKDNDSIAIGTNAGQTGQGAISVAIGLNAGQIGQGEASVAIGASAGQTSQGQASVAIGAGAGYTGQGSNSVAIGSGVAVLNQGQNCVAIGSGAGFTNQPDDTIVIGKFLEDSSYGNTPATFINPIRVNDTDIPVLPSGFQYLAWNSNTKEIIVFGSTGAQGLNLDFTVSNSKYHVNGEESPVINFVRGNTYIININTPGHPLYFQTNSGSYDPNNLYNGGITLLTGTRDNGIMKIVVRFDTPNILYYVCEIHPSMGNSITIIP